MRTRKASRSRGMDRFRILMLIQNTPPMRHGMFAARLMAHCFFAMSRRLNNILALLVLSIALTALILEPENGFTEILRVVLEGRLLTSGCRDYNPFSNVKVDRPLASKTHSTTESSCSLYFATYSNFVDNKVPKVPALKATTLQMSREASSIMPRAPESHIPTARRYSQDAM